MTYPQIEFRCAVEGPVDEAVLRKVLGSSGAKAGTVHVKKGKHRIKAQINGYNNSAKSFLWVVLIDLNNEYECAPPFKKSLLPSISTFMCLQIAVHEIEAWLMADRENLSKFLKVSTSRIPEEPESVLKPKLEMVKIARSSRSRVMSSDMVPRPGSGRPIGPGYPSRLIEFVWDMESGWRPDVASEKSDSLKRCMNCIKKFVDKFSN